MIKESTIIENGMSNLLRETIKELQDRGKSPKDVLWCGSKEFGYFGWRDFEEVANVIYCNDFGGEEVATDLLIVGKDFWLERHEYDGMEWWEYKILPAKPENYKKPRCLVPEEDHCGLTLKEIDTKDYD